MKNNNLQNTLAQYLIRGFSSRDEFLKSLVKKYNVSLTLVEELAFMYGEEQDFDALLSAMKIYETDKKSVEITTENEVIILNTKFEDNKFIGILDFPN